MESIFRSVENVLDSVHSKLYRIRILLKVTKLVIPSVLRNSIPGRLHEGHQDIVKCRKCACQSVWWPGLSQQLNEWVLKCRTCIKKHTNHSDTLAQAELPDRPWQGLGADVFTLKGQKHLLAVDYYSRFTEIANLTLKSFRCYRSSEINVCASCIAKDLSD